MHIKSGYLFFLILLYVFGNGFRTANANSDIINADPKYARQLILSFNTFCPSNGNWTSAALTESRKLQGLLESLRDDAQCSDISFALASYVDVLEDTLDRLAVTQMTEQDISSKQKAQMQILELLERRQ